MTQNKWSNKFTTFAVGVGIGALLALLFAPSSGEDTRDYLAGTLKQGFDGAASTGRRWTRRAQVAVDGVKANVAEAVGAGEKAYRTARDA
jgi:gas vesicle protein